MISRSFILVGLLLLGTCATAQPAADALCKQTSPAGTFAVRKDEKRGFAFLPAKSELRSKDHLIALPGATLTTINGSVTVKSVADYDGRAPLPILETALILEQPPEGIDLFFTLDRGRVDITNTKSRGAAVVKVRIWEQEWTLTLEEPGSRVGIELCGRWPAGTRFKPSKDDDKGKSPVPVARMVLLVIAGSAQLTSGDTTIGMRAPPGPAMLEWDSVAGAIPQPRKLNQLPEWADSAIPPSERTKQVEAALEKFRTACADKPDEAIKRFLTSENPIEQRIAIVTLGAFDDLVPLGQSLIAAKTVEEWDFGITVIRHWIGRAPGQDQKFYQNLINARGYSATQAMIVMQLLLGFSDAELRQPETYDVLIDYLSHEKPAIRNLAVWHLVRLVPQGKEIPYKPDCTMEEAKQVKIAWRKLIPQGELPRKE